MYSSAKNTLNKFIKRESTSGIFILITAAVAIVMVNSPLSDLYDWFWSQKISVLFEGKGLEKPLLLWVNDGLMAVFFLLVSMEIKREMLEGQLSSVSKIMLPTIAAIGGIVVPAGIYIALNYNDPVAIRGWGIPVATDIAFAICVVSILGLRFVPSQLKKFLLAIAIIDDVAAIVIIAIFYTGDLSTTSIITALIALLVLLTFNHFNVAKTSAYIVVGTVLWVAVLKSGIHATVAGVLVATMIPLKIPGSKISPLKTLESDLHPWIIYGVMPLFAFANAGVSFEGLTLSHLLHPIPLGIIAGLFFGKMIGISTSIYLAVKFKVCQLPNDTTWPMIVALGVVCGVGFTMSLFIGTLAFETPELNRYVRIGVLIGSTLSAVIGYGLFRLVKVGSRQT